jgi:hypothetical protein
VKSIVQIDSLELQKSGRACRVRAAGMQRPAWGYDELRDNGACFMFPARCLPALEHHAD